MWRQLRDKTHPSKCFTFAQPTVVQTSYETGGVGSLAIWSVYLIRCRDNTLYTGIATDVARRLKEHESGAAGAKYLRGRAPLELVFTQEVGDRSVACKVEYQVRKLPKSEKEKIHELSARIDSLLSELAAR